MKRILITGTARSGTGYAAEYLRRWVDPGDNGLVGHEDVYGLHRKVGHPTTPDIVIDPSKLAYPAVWGQRLIESSWLAAPYLNAMRLWSEVPDPDIIVVHLVRDPIKSIASIYKRGFLFHNSPYGRFAVSHLSGKFQELGPLERACHYWCNWHLNIMTSRRAQLVWRLETLSHLDLAYLLRQAGIDYTPMPPPTEDVNTGGYRDHDPQLVPQCLGQLPERFQEQVAAVASLFGYKDGYQL